MRAAVSVAALALAGCGGGPSGPAAERGERLIEEYGCGACHSIPGIAQADGRVGPSLADLDERRTIAGQLPNGEEELIRWIMDPQRIEPGTLMPDLGVSRAEARDIAKYLSCCT